jgi:hypothetical protein
MKSQRDAYLFYEAGRAVAAAYQGLAIRHISGNPAASASEILVPRDRPKARIIMWMTGMAAERKAVGRSDPLRRMRNRARLRTLVEGVMEDLTGSHAKRFKQARLMINQSQDRANAICSHFYQAIDLVAELLRKQDQITGEQVSSILAAVRERQSGSSDLDDKDLAGD